MEKVRNGHWRDAHALVLRTMALSHERAIPSEWAIFERSARRNRLPEAPEVRFEIEWLPRNADIEASLRRSQMAPDGTGLADVPPGIGGMGICVK